MYLTLFAHSQVYLSLFAHGVPHTVALREGVSDGQRVGPHLEHLVAAGDGGRLGLLGPESERHALALQLALLGVPLLVGRAQACVVRV